jgi:hypothetical protein
LIKRIIVKIRWTKNSVRLRITPQELEALQRGETIRESFPLGDAWHVAVVPSGQTALQFVESVLQITLSENDRAVLANPENEGVYFQTDTEIPLRYFIEKDFPCANPRAAEAMEPVTETFAPPSGFEARKKRC